MKRFKVGQDVVHPRHGPAHIIGINKKNIAGTKLELYILKPYETDGTIEVPVSKHDLRPILTPSAAQTALRKLTGARQKRNMQWHRIQRTMGALMHSGNTADLCEIVRDLYTKDGDERSYGLRQLYEKALGRLSQELALVFDRTPSELEALIEEAVESRQLPQELKTP